MTRDLRATPPLDLTGRLSGPMFMSHAQQHLSAALQPIYALSTGKVYAFEALCRGWKEMGVSSPHELYDIAEQVGVLVDLELSQIERALLAVSERFDRPRPRLFVNLDIRILESRLDFFDALTVMLDRYDFSTSEICIELSERHEKNDPESLRDQISELRKRGFRFALDDFGRGVSDLVALYYFDVTHLKIDRFLIDGIASTPRKRFFVSRLVELAHLLGQAVIAEGIETAEDLAVCAELNCDLAQGYHLGRPTERPTSERRPEFMHSDDATDVDGLEPLIETAPSVLDTERVTRVASWLMSDAPPSFVAIVDERERPIGCIDMTALNSFVAAPFTKDLLRNSTFELAASHFFQACPVSDVNVSPDRLLEMCVSAGADQVIITDEMRYRGVISAASLLAILQKRQLQQALERNPLSGLPGNIAIRRFIGTLLEATECDRALVYFDFNDFKTFNDTFGFEMGDQAIASFAALLRETFDDESVFLGHVGGDDFVLGAINADVDALAVEIDGVLETFAGRAADLLRRAEERIEASPTRGLSCSAAMVVSPVGMTFADPMQATAELAKLKRSAKLDHAAKVLVKRMSESDVAGAQDAAPEPFEDDLLVADRLDAVGARSGQADPITQ